MLVREKKGMRSELFRRHIEKLARETWLVSWELIRIMVPVVIVVKVLEEIGGVRILSGLLTPIMQLIGLPGELGLVWAAAMLTSLYGGIAVFAALAPGLDLTVAQVTVLCSAMLLAHALPVELSVSKKAGAPLWPIALLRFGGALVYGVLLDRFCLAIGVWQEPADLLFGAAPAEPTLGQWCVQQLSNIGLIVVVIFCILLLMRFLRRIGLLGLLERLLAPVLPLFGMSREAASLTVVGMVMGLGYGGALIIRESKNGGMGKRQVLNAMALMGLCHGLLEDTLVMMAVGGKLAGIFWGRILFSLVVTFLLVRILSILPDKVEEAG
ncbi:MAG: nucleoside recognition domain-containing protein [Desulfopila sp.]